MKENFNPRAPVGRDHLFANFIPRSELFQSTRPCGTRQSSSNESVFLKLEFQSTRPCGTRHNDVMTQDVQDTIISIHAPLWDATLKLTVLVLLFFISIHAPLWDATCNGRKNAPEIKNFNPRAPVGRDTVKISNLLIHFLISIHAPLWDATFSICIR